MGGYAMGLLYEEESYRVIGACFEVYKEKGPGFLEPVYQECLAIEFELSGIPFRSKAELKLEYKGRGLKQTYQPDFIVFDKIILELKALSELHKRHRAQVHNYLKATGLRLRLLVNFGAYPQLERHRIIR
jgi:GxxExxY protein